MPPRSYSRKSPPAGRPHHREGQCQSGRGSTVTCGEVRQRPGNLRPNEALTGGAYLCPARAENAEDGVPRRQPLVSAPLVKLLVVTIQRRYNVVLHVGLCQAPPMTAIVTGRLNHMCPLAAGWGKVTDDHHPCTSNLMSPKCIYKRLPTDTELILLRQSLDGLSGNRKRTSACTVMTEPPPLRATRFTPSGPA